MKRVNQFRKADTVDEIVDLLDTSDIGDEHTIVEKDDLRTVLEDYIRRKESVDSLTSKEIDISYREWKVLDTLSMLCEDEMRGYTTEEIYNACAYDIESKQDVSRILHELRNKSYVEYNREEIGIYRNSVSIRVIRGVRKQRETLDSPYSVDLQDVLYHFDTDVNTAKGKVLKFFYENDIFGSDGIPVGEVDVDAPRSTISSALHELKEDYDEFTHNPEEQTYHLAPKSEFDPCPQSSFSEYN